MNIAVIKKLNETIPYCMKKPFAGIIRNRLIKNKVFLKQYELLERADDMNEHEITKYQIDELKKVLIHAYRHTAYYRELMDSCGFNPKEIRSIDDLKRLPVLTKHMLKVNFERLQADDINNFYDVRTGGTTGEPTHVLLEKNSIYREWAFTYHYWSKFGYDYRKSRLATFRGVDLHGKLYDINPLYREIRINIFQLNRDNIKDNIRMIDKFAADFIYGYPSAIYNFCRLAREADIKLKRRFKAVLLISENLYDFQETEIKTVLACPIAMFYGHSERAVYAENYGDGYIFQPLYGITEISDEGHPIVTGFLNHKIPLIRYEVDDYVDPIDKDKDKVKIFGHRNSEIVYGSRGEQFRASALNFHGAISKIVPWFQFVQEVHGKLILRVPCGHGSLEELNKICAEIASRTGGAIEVTIEIMKDSPETSRGGYKYKLLVQKI